MFQFLFRFEPTALLWLIVSFVATVFEVSVPHFGSAFVSAGAIAAAAAAFFGFGLSVQLTVFIVVIHTFYGYTASGGPEGVGVAAARAVRATIVTIAATDVAMTMPFWGLHSVRLRGSVGAAR